MRLVTRLFITACVLLMGGALLLAQEDPAPKATAAPDCSPDALAAYQLEMAALLDGFADSVADDEQAALGALYAVGLAYRDAALACGYIPSNIGELVIGTRDLTRVLTVLDTLSGDPLNGQLLYNGEAESVANTTLGCSGCHVNAAVAPLTEGTWTRWDEQRRLLPQYAESDFRAYAVESILLPNAYTVEGYSEGAMPQFYPDALGYQDLADIIAYLESQDQLLED